jgi:hypothetical protein
MLLHPFTAITAVVGAVYCSQLAGESGCGQVGFISFEEFRFAKCDACTITLVGQVLHASYISSLSPILSYMVSKALLWVRRAACSMGSCQFNKHHSTSITGEVAVSDKLVDALPPIFLDYTNAASKCLAASSYLQA